MNIINNKEQVREKAILFFENLKDGIYILGTNKYGAAVKQLANTKGVSVHAFINDRIKDASFDATPVIKMNDLPSGSIVVNCIVEGRVIIAHNNITRANAKLQCDYFALQLAFPDLLPEPEFLGDTSSVIEMENDYRKLHQSLADDESKKTLENVVNFRLNRDISHMKDFDFKIDKQYFEPFVNLSTRPSFIDGGGFDGFTTSEFIRLYPGYHKVFYFEPTDVSMKMAKEKLKDRPNISFISKGLWDKNDTLFFDDSKSSANSIQEKGNTSIKVCAIDEVVNETVDFIKLDIEGAEINAMHGASEIISRYKPKLAVCVYHRQTDFINVPALALKLNPDYKIYLRHYTQGVFETVMYFV